MKAAKKLYAKANNARLKPNKKLFDKEDGINGTILSSTLKTIHTDTITKTPNHQRWFIILLFIL